MKESGAQGGPYGAARSSLKRQLGMWGVAGAVSLTLLLLLPIPAVRRVLALVNLCCGLVAVMGSLPLLYGRVPRNNLFGYRFRESMASEEAWFLINRYGAERTIRWGLCLFVVATLALFVPLRSSTLLLTGFMAAGPALLLVALGETYRFARRVAKNPPFNVEGLRRG